MNKGKEIKPSADTYWRFPNTDRRAQSCGGEEKEPTDATRCLQSSEADSWRVADRLLMKYNHF